MASPRILVLTASTGNGHISAANAILGEAETRGMCVAVEDVLDHCPKAFRAWYAGGYETLVRKRPWVWGHLYRTSDRPLLNFWFQTYLDWTFCARLELLIHTFRPDWVVCTHSLPQTRLSVLKKRFNFKLAVVVTDVYPHRMWLRGKVDHYFVPLESTKECLLRRYRGGNCLIDVVGMPIKSDFVAGKRAGQEHPPVVLLTAGGIGGGPMEAAASALAALPISLRIVAGRNKELHDGLIKAFGNYPNVQVFGLVSQPEMAQLLKEADIFVSKPGGLATFESLACGCAFVILKALLIPGQEEENARYLVSIGAGVSVDTIDQLSSTVSRLVGSPDQILAMQLAALQHAKPNAAKDIVDILLAPE